MGLVVEVEVGVARVAEVVELVRDHRAAMEDKVLMV
jgi:hypothetical protein